MGVERRKYVRFLAKDTAFAALRSGFKKVGRIKDISIGGLAFSYFSETCEMSSDSYVSQVDIFLSGNGFHLYNVPCNIVCDLPNSLDDEGFYVKMNRCCLHFGELTENQLEQLSYFIKHYATKLES
jgi:hypothetical protein